MEPEIQRKIEETVIDILKRANFEDMTEFKARGMASVRLGIDLSDIRHKSFVRGVVESFLLSSSDHPEVPTDQRRNSNGTTILEETRKEVVRQQREPPLNPVICKLSNKRNVMIQDVNGKSLLWIGEFYQKDGKQLPSHKGISLTNEQWLTFRNSIPAIQEAVTKMQSKLRLDLNGEQSGHGLNPVASPPPPPPPSQVLVGIEISRFDGNNYQSWARKMEFFLSQLNIGYVLSHPCPSPAVSDNASPKESPEAKAQLKWMNDNYMCRHHILTSLSDALYSQYSKKTKSAKELWETLKLVYLFEELGTKRFQVKKYIEFQMVDEKPVLDQIQEFNSIADSIVATGSFLDENFHVSVILSKLPPSWKDFCIKLMNEEYLPFFMLMDRVRVEEESRNRGWPGEASGSVFFHHANNLGPKMRDMKRPGLHWKRHETEMSKTIPVCSFCGKKGHISKNCRNKKFDKEANEKRDREISSTHAVSGVNMENGRQNVNV